MIEFLQRLRQRKLVQWGLAYLAAAFAIVQAVDLVAEYFGWPPSIGRYLILVFAVGFLVLLVLAWYHGDRGAQRVSGTELLIVALLLAIGGVVVSYFGPTVIQRRNTIAARGPAMPGSVATTAARVHVPAKSIAVLPFENLSSDKENDYFVAGMQDLILAKLADIGDLKVISRTSTLKYKSHPDNLRKVAAELGVATLVEGSVQKQGRQVLITVQLIDARTDTHLWAQTYPRTLDNIFGVEGEVAGMIANALHATLSPTQSAQLASTPTTNQAAYDLFLRAEYQTSRGVIREQAPYFQAAIPLYRKAVAEDPTFALAWARLSFAQTILAFFGGGGENVPQLHKQARQDAEHSLKLQPDLPAARVALGYSYQLDGYDYAHALEIFQSVLTVRPNDVDALAGAGLAQRGLGRFEASIALLARAVTLDPRGYFAAFHLAIGYMYVGRYGDAQTWFQRALALVPDSVVAKRLHARAILYGNGDIPRALAAAQGDDSRLQYLRVELLTYQRQFRAAIALLESIPDTQTRQGPSRDRLQTLALLHWQAGDTAQARPLFARVLPLDRAALATTHGLKQAYVWYGIAQEELGLGHAEAGLAALAKFEALAPQVSGARDLPRLQLEGAAGYAMAGLAGRAVPMLSKVVAAPRARANYPPVMLWLDPAWDPIRTDPRFQTLLARYTSFKPAIIPAATTISR